MAGEDVVSRPSGGRMARARARRVGAGGDPAPVLWRDGVHVVGTPIWCDARRAREVCFASRFEAVPPARHGQLIATAETLALYGEGARGAVLSVPLGRPFSLGAVRLELLAAGGGLGAAALALEVGGRRVVYAGALGRGEGLGGAADHRACDVLVLGCADAGPGDLPPRAAALSAIAERWRAVASAGGALVAIVTGALDGLELLAGLGPIAGRALVAASGLAAAAARARTLAPAIPAVRRAGPRIGPGELVVWPLGRRGRAAGPGPGALPSGSLRLWVGPRDRGLIGRAGADDQVGWTVAADAGAALAHARASGARAIYLVGPAGAALVPPLAAAGIEARPLAAPEQMSLF